MDTRYWILDTGIRKVTTIQFGIACYFNTEERNPISELFDGYFI